jgi:hypothetical protein
MLGLFFGDSVERSLRSHPLLYFAGGAAIVAAVVVIAVVRVRRRPAH